MLRPPSESSSFPGLTYLDEDANSQYRPVSNIVGVTVPVRADTDDSYDINEWVDGPSNLSRRNTNVIQQIANFDQRTPLELHEEEETRYTMTTTDGSSTQRSFRIFQFNCETRFRAVHMSRAAYHIREHLQAKISWYGNLQRRSLLELAY